MTNRITEFEQSYKKQKQDESANREARIAMRTSAAQASSATTPGAAHPPADSTPCKPLQV